MKRFKFHVGAVVVLMGAALFLFLGIRRSAEVSSNAMAVPTGVARISADQVTRDSSGQLLVRDEIIVGLDFDTPNPEARIVEIALSTHGVIVGSVPDALTYQLRYVVADLDALEAIRVSLEGMPDVDFASRHLVLDWSTLDSQPGP